PAAAPAGGGPRRGGARDPHRRAAHRGDADQAGRDRRQDAGHPDAARRTGDPDEVRLTRGVACSTRRRRERAEAKARRGAERSVHKYASTAPQEQRRDRPAQQAPYLAEVVKNPLHVLVLLEVVDELEDLGGLGLG